MYYQVQRHLGNSLWVNARLGESYIIYWLGVKSSGNPTAQTHATEILDWKEHRSTRGKETQEQKKRKQKNRQSQRVSSLLNHKVTCYSQWLCFCSLNKFKQRICSSRRQYSHKCVEEKSGFRS